MSHTLSQTPFVTAPVDPQFEACRHWLPLRVILGGGEVLRQFEAHTRALPMAHEPYVEHLLSELIDYLHDRDSAVQFLDDYVEETYRTLSSGEDAAAKQYCQCLLALGLYLFELVKARGCYTAAGALWYEFDGLVGKDIVLRLHDPDN